MKGEFTAIIEEAPEGGYWAICLEIPGANGQGESIEEAEKSLRDAIQLIIEPSLKLDEDWPVVKDKDEAVSKLITGQEKMGRSS